MFKVGDKVRILSHAPGAWHKTGVVFRISDSIRYPIKVNFDDKTYHTDWGDCPYRENELESMGPKVGEQLVFDFMKEGI